MQADGLIRVIAIGEIVALENTGNGELAQQAQNVFHFKIENPVSVVHQVGLFLIKDLKGLIDIGLRICVDLFARKLRTRAVAARGVADKSRAVADDERDAVTQILELTELTQRNSVADVDIGSRGIDAELDIQRLAALQLFKQILFRDDGINARSDDVQLLFCR